LIAAVVIDVAKNEYAVIRGSSHYQEEHALFSELSILQLR